VHSCRETRGQAHTQQFCNLPVLTPRILHLLSNRHTRGTIRGTQALVAQVRLKDRRGKSGGYRVIYYLPDDDATLLLALYSKSDQADIPADELKRIIIDELGS